MTDPADYRITGYRQGGEPEHETEHFIRCACGHMIDCRDLGEVMDHAGHGGEQATDGGEKGDG